MAVYPLLVAASGLWLKHRLVHLVTRACLTAHAILAVVAAGPVAWHVAGRLDVLILRTAAITAFQIGRIRLPRGPVR